MKFVCTKMWIFVILWICIIFGNCYSQETPVKPCEPDPCRNNGVCVESGKEFFCRCRRPFSGPTCQNVEPCKPNPCHHAGTCEESGENFICRCSETFTGPKCETEISPSACIPNPCENKADCLDDNGTSVCLCRDGFGDLYCQTDDLIPIVAEIGGNVDISCMNSQNISEVTLEITDTDSQRQKRKSYYTIRLESVEKSDVKSRLLCHYQSEDTNSTTSKLLPLIVVEKKTETSETFTTFTCTAFTTVKSGVIDIKTDILKTGPNISKRDVNVTLEDGKDTSSIDSEAKDDISKADVNITLEKDRDTNDTAPEREDVEEVSQSKFIFSKSERIKSSTYNVRCSVSYNGKEIWSGSVAEKKEVRPKGKEYGEFPAWAWVLIGLVIVGGITAIIVFNVYTWRRSKVGKWKASENPVTKEEGVELKESTIPLKSDAQE